MSVYLYKAKRSPTDIVSGEINAETQAQAVSMLDGMGLVPVSVTERPSDKADNIATSEARPVYRGLKRAPAKAVDTFMWQLASLLKANVSILKALSLVGQQSEYPYLREVVGRLERQVRDGTMLSQAMEEFPRLFDRVTVSIIRAGEKGGVLSEVLLRLAEGREKQREVERTIQAALAYPALIIIVGAVSVYLMLTVFLPKLMVLFESMKGNLPLPTQILLAVSDFTTQHWYWILAAVIVLAAAVMRRRAGSDHTFLFEIVRWHCPFVRKFARYADIAKFARTLGLLLKNGVPISVAIGLAADVLDNEILKRDLGKAIRDIIDRGETVAGSLRKVDGFPNFAVNMISVGEEGGQLDASLHEIGDTYEREVNHAVKIMASLIEPVLILAVGAVVGFIVFAMLMPIFQIGQRMN